jgi:endonuclease/exonuclease/phosphatase family metal-dependent hydrolase
MATNGTTRQRPRCFYSDRLPKTHEEHSMFSKNRASVFALLFTVGLAVVADGSHTHAAEPTSLRVLCYNIHYGQGTDGRYDLQRLAAVINEAKPDLVALQEVDVGVKRSGRVHQAKRLAELTDMAVRFGPTQHYEGGLFGNAVLTRLPILDVAIHPLPYTESTPQRVTYPRGAIAVTVRGPDGEPLRFVSTHFQHNVPEDRLAEAKAINKLFGQQEQLPTILAGDMNAVPDSEPIQELLRIWTNITDKPPSPTAPSTNPTSRIDYIFCRPASLFRVSHAAIVSESVASDHCPVLAVLELSAR